MAELTDADKRAIYGDEYEVIIAREETIKKAPVTAADKRRALAMRLETNDTGLISAVALAFTGLCLLLGSLYRRGNVDIAGWIGIAGLIVGVLWYAYLIKNARMWRSQLIVTGKEMSELQRRERDLRIDANQASA